MHGRTFSHVIGSLFETGTHDLDLARQWNATTPVTRQDAIDVEVRRASARVTHEHHVDRSIEHGGHVLAVDSAEQVVSHTKLGGSEETLFIPLIELDGKRVISSNRGGGTSLDGGEVERVASAALE